MICRVIGIIFMFTLLSKTTFGQKKKEDLYLYFKTDSAKRIYKNVKNEDDIYTYSYISKDGSKELIYDLFSSLSKNNYCFTDSSIFKKQKVLPYQNLERIKGLISDDWNDKNFAYKGVFIVEKIAENQFKTTKVQLFFPFTSNGFRSIIVGSKEIIDQP